MQPADFHYELPDELIARYPAAERSSSRLLRLLPDGSIVDDVFHRLPESLTPGDLLVFNDTKVVKARLFGRKQTGGRIELLIERVTGGHTALVQIRASKAPKPGGSLEIIDAHGAALSHAEVRGRDGRFFDLEFDMPVSTLMDTAGHVPLPPYIDRVDEVQDQLRYQTIYARVPGAVAAPTAGLHFDDALLSAIDAAGVQRQTLTLHVGAGTFQPLTEQQLATNTLHEERLSIDRSLVDAVAATRAAGKRVIAVGTTSLRALESAATDGQLQAGERETDLFIRPGYRFRVVDGLVTNFHLPASSLMMLVGAFAGVDPIMAAYRHAVRERYRFFSYGDAMLLWRADREQV
ncbi:MAG: tRNA preQ1(34) S-adenosylmethionine ribosyltransferase-isomerase QueA [Pseudomonadota bacterium]